jgi:SAM-dependent methyltransferase
VPGRWAYNILYRVGAARLSRGWDKGPGPEVVELAVSGRLSPALVTPPRVVDLGCGTGANVNYLAERGFEAVGVDFSTVAIERARANAEKKGLSDRTTFVVGDVTAERIDGVEGPFGIAIVYNTLQDLLGEDRVAVASLVRALTVPGSLVVLWCWYGEPSELPLFTFNGPSRLMPFVVSSKDVDELFGRHFSIERLPDPRPETGKACFLMRRER